jgi:O-antigen/teichoic acid export membrane protein
VGRGAVLRRAGWSVVDQAFSSLTNFALTILVARALSPRLFGAFTVAYLLYVFLLQLSRAISSEALVVRYSAAPKTWRDGAAKASGVALLFGLVSGCLTLGVALAFPEPLRSALIAMAIVLPGLILQDAWRFVFFAKGRPVQAAVNDMTWALVQFPALLFLLTESHPTVPRLVLVWGGSATVAALLGAFQARLIPAPQRCLTWFREQRDLIPQFAMEFIAFRGALQLTSYAVGIVAGLAALGSLRAAQVLFGPLSLFFLSAGIVGVPESVRLLERSGEHLRQAVRRMSVGLTLAAAVWGAPLLFLPNRAGTALLHANWHDARPLLLPTLLATAAAGANVGSRTGLRALQAANDSLRARLVIGPLTVALGTAGAVWDGALGAAIGLAAAAWIGVGVYERLYRRAADRLDRQGSGTTWLPPENVVAPS